MGTDIILGCDIGTGSCKITACYTNGEPVHEVHSYYNTQQSKPGYISEDPVLIKNAFVDCFKKILRLLPAAPAAMGFSSAMHSLMLVDGDNRPLTNLIVWEDNRSREIARKLRDSPLGVAIYEKTGTPIHSMSPLCKIKWFHDHDPGLFDRAAKFIGIKEFLWYWMFHHFEVDISIGSATGLMNIQNLEWEKDSLKFCRITDSRLSAIVSTTYIRTNPSEEFVKATGAPSQMKYCIGASDGCLANYGSGIDSTNKAALTIGTSGAVRLSASKPLIHDKTMIFNYLLDKNIFICGGPVNNGGNVLLWLFKTFLGKDKPDADDYAALENKLSQIPAGAQGLVCLPWLLGERAPVWDEDVSGVWMGVRSYHTPFHFFKAALEGICFNLRTILESMEEVSGPVSYLYAGGGFTRSAQWVQMMADITQKKVVVNQGTDASALGAVLWTIHALGIKTNKVQNEDAIFIYPDKTTSAIVDRHYSVFCNLYRNMADQMHTLIDS